MTTPLPDASDTAPAFTAGRLLYVATGGMQAMFMPMWLSWLHANYPDTEVRPVLTRAARSFVGPTSVAAAGRTTMPATDVWPDEPDTALHVDLAAWPDAVLVHPATMHFVARYSLGMADTPTLLALQCTRAPVVVCPALPPNGHINPAFRRHVDELSERDHVTVLPPIRGVSMRSGEEGVGAVAMLPHAVAALEDLRTWSEAV